jgi:hypothetical protein
MNWRHLFIAIAVFALLSCNESKQQQFTFEIVNVTLPATAKNSVPIGSYTLVEDSSGTIYVLDSAYRRVTAMEQKINPLKLHLDNASRFNEDLLFYDHTSYVVLDSSLDRKPNAEQALAKHEIYSANYYKDAMLFLGRSKLRTILPTYKVVEGNPDSFCREHLILCETGARLVFDDDAYAVYACGPFGEFNGTVYFQNKATNKAYTIPAYFADIDTFNGSYYITECFDWREPNTHYSFIKDPSTLLPNTLTKEELVCNGDSGYYKWSQYRPKDKKVWQKRGGAWEYYSSHRFWPCKLFVTDNQMYSLNYNDSMYYVLHHGDSTRVIDSVKTGKGNHILKYTISGRTIELVKLTTTK